MHSDFITALAEHLKVKGLTLPETWSLSVDVLPATEHPTYDAPVYHFTVHVADMHNGMRAK